MRASVSERKATEWVLSKRIFIQFDICPRELKNRNISSFSELLLWLSVFQVLNVSFSPFGHTHFDMDHSLCADTNRLKLRNALTMTESHDQLSQWYSNPTVVSSLQELAMFSRLCTENDCVITINLLTQYQFFRFTKTQETGNERDVFYLMSPRSKVTCTAYRHWKSLKSKDEEICPLNLPQIWHKPHMNCRGPMITSAKLPVGVVLRSHGLTMNKNSVILWRSETGYTGPVGRLPLGPGHSH